VNKIIMTAVAVPALALSLAACGSKHTAAGASASAEASSVKASASAFASSAQGRQEQAQARALVKKCFPASETGQLKLAEPVKGKAARTQAETCLEIPEGAQRTQFDEALLGAALSAHLKTSAGRAQFTEVTVPELLLSYKGKP
jgi:hypothetical protein